MKPDRRDRTDITMAGSQDIIELPKKCMPDESNFDIRLTRAAKDWSSFTKVDTTEKVRYFFAFFSSVVSKSLFTVLTDSTYYNVLFTNFRRI